MLLALTGTFPRTHAVEDLYDALPELQPVLGQREKVSRLDRFYTLTRYPDGLPGRIPAKHFTVLDTAEVLPVAERVVGACVQTLAALQAKEAESQTPGEKRPSEEATPNS